MKLRHLIVPSLAFVAYAYAQTCVTGGGHPASPPTPTQATVTLPADGGTSGCTFTAFCPGCGGQPTNYWVSNAKCSTMVAMAKQAAANDNGWDDGGVP